MNCELGNHINKEGWENWRNPANEKTARYAEYNNRGEGAAIDKRVTWSRQLNKKEAQKITLETVFKMTTDWVIK